MNADEHGEPVVVVFPTSLGAGRWRTADHGLPDTSPYGFDRLGSYMRARVSLEERDRDGPVGLMRGLVMDRLHRSPRSGPIYLGWDESSALLFPPRHRSRFRASGLIWATDGAPSGIVEGLKMATLRERLRTLDLVWCLSAAQVQAARSWLGDGGPAVQFLRFGIDADYYSYQRPASSPLIVSAGGDRDRDVASLMRCFELIRQVRPECELVVQSSASIQAPEGVRLVAKLSHAELRHLYGRATASVVMTRDNVHASGMTVALETQAVGRPVVACRTPGMEDYVDDQVTGHLVPVGDAEAAADRLVRLIDNADRAAAMGRAARRKVEAGHTTQKMMQELSRLLPS